MNNINLLPKKPPVDRIFAPVLSGVIALSLLAGSTVVYLHARTQSDTDSLRQQIAADTIRVGQLMQVKSVKPGEKELQAIADAITSLQFGRREWTPIVRAIEVLLPEGGLITAFAPHANEQAQPAESSPASGTPLEGEVQQKDMVYELTLTLDSLHDIPMLITALKSNGMFTKVELLSLISFTEPLGSTDDSGVLLPEGDQSDDWDSDVIDFGSDAEDIITEEEESESLPDMNDEQPADNETVVQPALDPDLVYIRTLLEQNDAIADEKLRRLDWLIKQKEAAERGIKLLSQEETREAVRAQHSSQPSNQGTANEPSQQNRSDDQEDILSQLPPDLFSEQELAEARDRASQAQRAAESTPPPVDAVDQQEENPQQAPDGPIAQPNSSSDVSEPDLPLADNLEDSPLIDEDAAVITITKYELKLKLTLKSGSIRKE